MHSKEQVGLYIMIASHQIRRKVDSISACHGLTGIQSRILSYICASPDKEVFQKEIEKNFGIRRSSVTSVISNLEQNGFLNRKAVPADARQKKLVLTQKGMEADQKVSTGIKDFEQSLNDLFSDGERKTLLDLLGRITDTLGGGCARQAANKTMQGKDETIC